VRTWRGVVQYDGTAYAGFQRQSSAPTIQGTLEEALRKVTQEHTAVIGAGRTDARVHARGQVVSFSSETRLEAPTLMRALNTTVPRDIVLSSLEEAERGFNARYDARSRAYEYIVYNTALPSPFWTRYSHHVPDPLDTAGMSAALGRLVGEHDFAAFGMPMERTRDGVTERGGTVRLVLGAHCRVRRPFVYFYIEANAFLRHMVRLIVGTVLRVGRGRLKPEDVRAILDARHIAAAGPAAPAQGLYLVQVTY